MEGRHWIKEDVESHQGGVQVSQPPFLKKGWQDSRGWWRGGCSRIRAIFFSFEEGKAPAAKPVGSGETQATQGSLHSDNWKCLFPHQLADGSGLGAGPATARTKLHPPGLPSPTQPSHTSLPFP